jgi:hypothetical protein
MMMNIDALDHATEVAFTGAGGPLPDLGRTEDCRFSPDGRLMMIAGFHKSQIALFRVARAGDAGAFGLEGMAWLTHPTMQQPHGVDFIDARTIAVANRKGRLCVHTLPEIGFDGGTHVAPLCLEINRASIRHRMATPGSVAVIDQGPGRYGLLVCLNHRRQVALQSVRVANDRHRKRRGRIVLERGMEVPDGVSVCRASGRVAISNHYEHAVRVYPSPDGLSRQAEPSARLIGVDYPHGLRFFDKGRAILVADAGAPLLHLYRDAEARWQGGDRMPDASFRIMDDATFERGHYNAREGGAKGIDIDPAERVVVVTSAEQQLAAFDLKALMRLANDLPATSAPAG